MGAGVGSSAAAIVGALAASYRLADRTLFDEEIVSLATQREGHPDNVAAAWHGGFTVAVESAGRVLSYSCPVPEPLGLVLVAPDYALSTEDARKVLPEKYSRADAVHNLQRAAVLTAQIFSGKAELHRCFFDDRWHQSFRSHLVPGLPEVLALKHPDLLGICLSGAGPSLLAFTRGETAAIGELIQNTLARETGEVPHLTPSLPTIAGPRVGYFSTEVPFQARLKYRPQIPCWPLCANRTRIASLWMNETFLTRTKLGSLPTSPACTAGNRTRTKFDGWCEPRRRRCVAVRTNATGRSLPRRNLT